MSGDNETTEGVMAASHVEAWRARVEAGIARVVHEMRNPLSAIRVSLKVIEAGVDPARTKEALELIIRQISYLTRLVDDLLDTSRLSSGTLTVIKSQVCLKEIINQALETASVPIRNGEHTVTVVLPDDSMAIDGDRHRLVQVLTNLIENAAKYTPPKGVISVTGTMSGDSAEVAIKDSGIGIPPERLQDVFQQFTRIPDPTVAADGIGLGSISFR